MTYGPPPPDAPWPPEQPQHPHQPEKQNNPIGLIALITAIVGFIFACIPGALFVGWILLPISFILGIVGAVLSGKKKGTSIAAIIVAVVGTIVGAIVFVAVVGGALDAAFSTDDLTADDSQATEADESPDSTQTDEATDAEESPGGGSGGETDTDENGEEDNAAEDADQGTRDNPFQIGEPVSNNDWTVTLGDPYEANDVVADENEFNDPPEDGSEFWIVPVEATYKGTDTGLPWIDITVEFVGDDGHTYNWYQPGCGVFPDPLDEVSEMYADATAEGNVCIQVPEGAPGLWTLTVGFFGDRVFFSAD